MKYFRQGAQVISFVLSHPSNREHRLRAIVRAVVFQLRGRLGKRTCTLIGRNARMWADLHHSAASKAVYANPPDWNEMQAWRQMLHRGDLFVDVGANVGTYTLWAADCGAVVIAVEPDPQAAALLRENVALNDFAITVVEAALSAEAGSLLLTEGNDTTNHLLVDVVANEGRRVQARTLDDVLDGHVANGVKIDVEGAERLVLEGARESLAAGRIRVLQLEWNSMSESVLHENRAPVIAILAQYNYSLHRPDERGRLHPADGQAYGSDLFALAPTYGS